MWVYYHCNLDIKGDITLIFRFIIISLVYQKNINTSYHLLISGVQSCDDESINWLIDWLID